MLSKLIIECGLVVACIIARPSKILEVVAARICLSVPRAYPDHGTTYYDTIRESTAISFGIDTSLAQRAKLLSS